MAFGGLPTVLGSGLPIAGGGSTIVSGPASSTDEAIVRWDGTAGNLVQNSGVTMSDVASNVITINAVAADLKLAAINGTGATFTLERGANGNAILTPSGTGRVLTIDGTAARPAYSFTSDSDTGIATILTNAVSVIGGGTEVLRALSTGPILFGTTTDSSNGRIQLATHTTSAGGFGLGTDVSLYRSGVNGLVLLGTGTADMQLNIQRTGGTASSWTLYSPSGTNSFIIRGGSGPTDALVFDASANLTYAATMRVSTDTLSGAGAVSVTKDTTKLTSTGVAEAITLADGADGQIKRIVHDVDGGSMVLTPTTKTGFSTVTFTNAGDTVMLQFFTTRGWMVMANYGAVVAP